MSKALWQRLAIPALLALSLAGCGKEDTEEKAPAPVGPVPLKQRPGAERVKRLAEGAADILALGGASPEQAEKTLLALYFDYLPEPPTGKEHADEFYDRLCTSAWKDACAQTFPEDYPAVAMQNLLDAMLAEKELLGEKISMSGLSEAQVTLLQEKKVLEELRGQVKIAKADRAPWIFLDHPLRLPERESSVKLVLVMTDKGDVTLNGNKLGGKTPFALPAALNAPAKKPDVAVLSDTLAGLKAEWEEKANAEEKALAEGKTPPAGTKLVRPFDSYIEIRVQPNAPAWYLAWALSAIDESGLSNPVLVVRSGGAIPRKGMLPFPLGRSINKVAKVAVKKSGPELPKDPITVDTLVKIIPDDGLTVQELAKAIDQVGGCKEDPCGSLQGAFIVARWDD